MVDASVSGAASLGAHAGAAGSNALPVRAGVPGPAAKERLILADAHDPGGEWIAIRIGHTGNGDGHELVVRRPQLDGSGERDAAFRWAIASGILVIMGTAPAEPGLAGIIRGA